MLSEAKFQFKKQLIPYNNRVRLIMSEKAKKEQKISNHKNYQKLFPPNVCVYCGGIIEGQHESYKM